MEERWWRKKMLIRREKQKLKRKEKSGMLGEKKRHKRAAMEHLGC